MSDRFNIREQYEPRAPRDLHMRATPEEWRTWAIQSRAHHAVVSYMFLNPRNLYNENVERDSPRPSPYTWDLVSQVMLQVEKTPFQPGFASQLIIALLGEQIGQDFIGYLLVQNAIPNIDSILNGTAKSMGGDFKNNMHAQYSIAMQVAYKLRDSFESTIRGTPVRDTFNEHLDIAAQFLHENLKIEVMAMFLRTLFHTMRIMPNIKTHGYLKKIIEEYGSMLVL